MSGAPPPLQPGRRPVRPAEADIFRECPRCRHPMRRHPMRRWSELREVHLQRRLAQFDAGGLPRRRDALAVWGTVYLFGFLIDEIDVRLRQSKHRRLNGRARRDDWVCPNCLHREGPDDNRLR